MSRPPGKKSPAEASAPTTPQCSHGEEQQPPPQESSSVTSSSWYDETEREWQEAGAPSASATPWGSVVDEPTPAQKPPPDSGGNLVVDLADFDLSERCHTVWGGVEKIGESSSSKAGSSSVSSACKSRNSPRKILNRSLNLAEVQMLDSSHSSGPSDREQQQATASQGHAEQAALPPQALEQEPPERPQHQEVLPSMGSDAHLSGACKPCLFLVGGESCSMGAECRFCHFPHTKSSLIKKSKGVRTQMKKLLNRARAEEGEDGNSRRWRTGAGAAV